MSSHSTPPLAYSYIRFSDPKQCSGDSIRRQTADRDGWLARHPTVKLDTALTLRDAGVSAFRGKHRENPDRHALAAFLKLVEQGRVPPGSYLLIENLDRLSREDEVPACHLLTGILLAGVKVVQLSPYEMELTEKSNGWELMRAVMELSRGHGESAMKSQRCGDAWEEKRRQAREHGTPLTSTLPAWIELVGDQLRTIPERAAVVQRIFHLATQGRGGCLIAKLLTRDQVPCWTRSGRWNKCYINHILSDRRALGEYQPYSRRNGHRSPEGAPILGYYPGVVTVDLWNLARAGALQRKRHPGRTGEHVNVFAGLLRNGRDGDTYFCTTRLERRHPERHQRILVNTAATQRGAPCFSFPYQTFERAVLGLLREIKPAEILNGDNGADSRVQALGSEFTRVQSAIAMLQADLDEHGDSPALYQRLRAKETEQRRLAEELARASQEAAHPISASWGELHTLLDVLDQAADPQDVRLRIRSALRRITDSIWLLVVPRGLDRVAAVQIWFAGQRRYRNYAILHRPPRSNARSHKPGQWWVRSFADVGLPAVDVRDRDQAAKLAKALESAVIDQQSGKPLPS